jgi:hypothetical protein
VRRHIEADTHTERERCQYTEGHRVGLPLLTCGWGQTRAHAIRGFAQFCQAVPALTSKVADVLCQLFVAGAS